jgi:hypothetical protein
MSEYPVSGLAYVAYQFYSLPPKASFGRQYFRDWIRNGVIAHWVCLGFVLNNTLSHKGHCLIVLRVYLKQLTGYQKIEEIKPKNPPLNMNKKQRLNLKITAYDPEVDSHLCSEYRQNCLSHDKKRCLDSLFKRFNLAA